MTDLAIVLDSILEAKMLLGPDEVIVSPALNRALHAIRCEWTYRTDDCGWATLYEDGREVATHIQPRDAKRIADRFNGKLPD